jgi:hypothetical protein
MLNNVYELQSNTGGIVTKVLNEKNYNPDWAVLSPVIDDYVKVSYSGRELVDFYRALDEAAENKEICYNLLYAFLRTKEYEYNTVFSVTQLAFNPIENYRMIETESITNDGTNEYGERTDATKTTFGEMSTEESATLGEGSTTVSREYGETNAEEKTVTGEGSTEAKRNYGETHTDQMTVNGEGKATVNREYGEQITTNNTDFGAAASTTTAENKVAPYESSGYKSKDKSETSVSDAAKSDKNTIKAGAKSDKETTEEAERTIQVTNDEAARLDVETTTEAERAVTTTSKANKHSDDELTTEAERTNTSTSNTAEHSDDTKATKGAQIDKLQSTIKRELTRSGNIGVTTSQQMAESSLELAQAVRLVETIARDVANLVSKGVYYLL